MPAESVPQPIIACRKFPQEKFKVKMKKSLKNEKEKEITVNGISLMRSELRSILLPFSLSPRSGDKVAILINGKDTFVNELLH